MVKIVLRAIQEVKDWNKLEELEAKMLAMEEKMGLPAKRRLRSVAGPLSFDTLIIEWEYPSMAAWEEASHKIMANQEYMAGMSSSSDIVGSVRYEVYSLWPPQI